MVGLMLSLSTVMCCYATQAEKALLCLYAWLHDTRRGGLRKDRREEEKYRMKEWRQKKKKDDEHHWRKG